MPGDAPQPSFFRPRDELRIHEGHLPHWRQDGVTYFITTRLADSMPEEKLAQWQQHRDRWLQAHGLQTPDRVHELTPDQQHEFHTTFTAEWQGWLDAGHGECWLRRPDVRALLLHRLLEEPGLDAWVIMPNHLHALVSPEDKTLGKMLQRWKGGSAFAINQHLGRSGVLWQKETYDHIVRSEAQMRHYRRYITENPVKARLRAGEYALGMGQQVLQE